MSDILANKLGNFEAWRLDNLQQIRVLDQWLQGCNLVNDQVRSLLTDMCSRLQSQQLKVAFVAEFSRGKSELINAIFFASGGRRIMPASVGRTTMCPVEIGYDENWPPCIRLLPLETRRENISLAEWRYDHHDAWLQEPLDIDDMDKLAQSMVKVSERRYVTAQEAAELGLWDEENPENNPSANALGLVEIPKWRHAIVNYPHPLLKRGISILDTPGLNTVGVEPELTLDLLPQAHAVLFILAADTGVTRSDLQIWRDYLSGSNATDRPCYVLLNKIDVLWDGLLSAQEAEAQLQQQRESCAALLDVPLSRIFAVSAQKGLLGKIKNNFQLLQDSKLLLIERLFVRELLPKRQEILQQVLTSGVGELRTHVHERFANQLQTLDTQIEELQGLHGKNADIAGQISTRIIGQKEVLESLRKKASAMRVAEKKMLRQLQKRMDHAAIDRDMIELSVAIQDQGLRLSLSKIFEKTMELLRQRVLRAEQIANQFEALLTADMQELEKEYGIKLTIQPSPGIGNLMSDVDMVRNRHDVFFGINQSLRLRRVSYADQLFKTLLTRVRSVFDEAFDMLDMWSNNSYSVLVVQVGDLEVAIKNLYSGIQRIQSAKEPLSDRLDEMQTQRMRLWQRQKEFDMHIHNVQQLSQNHMPRQPDELRVSGLDRIVLDESDSLAGAEMEGAFTRNASQGIETADALIAKNALEIEALEIFSDDVVQEADVTGAIYAQADEDDRDDEGQTDLACALANDNPEEHGALLHTEEIPESTESVHAFFAQNNLNAGMLDLPSVEIDFSSADNEDLTVHDKEPSELTNGELKENVAAVASDEAVEEPAELERKETSVKPKKKIKRKPKVRSKKNK